MNPRKDAPDVDRLARSMVLLHGGHDDEDDHEHTGGGGSGGKKIKERMIE